MVNTARTSRYNKQTEYIYLIFSRTPEEIKTAKADNTIPVPEIQYGYVSAERVAKDMVKTLNDRGHVNGHMFYYERIEQMKPTNFYLQSTAGWLKPVETTIGE